MGPDFFVNICRSLNFWMKTRFDGFRSKAMAAMAAKLLNPVCLEAQPDSASHLIASLLLVAMPFAPSSFLLPVVRPGAPSSVRSLPNNWR